MAEHKGYDRLVNFTDAVVAIAATLLILPVVDAATTISAHSVDRFISEVFPDLFMFLLSFAVIGNFWLEHHRLFRLIDKFDTALIFMNFAWLAGIVIMPVPTALIVDGSSHDEISVAFYIGTMVEISFTQFLMNWHVQRHPDFEHGASKTKNRLLGTLIVVVFLVIALILGTTMSAVGLWGLVLLFLVPVTVRIVQALRARSKR